MAAPDITIAVEPVEAGKAVYLPLAAKAADQDQQLKGVLRLRITNNYADQVVVVNAIQFSFPGSAAPAKDMQGIALVLDPDGVTKPSEAMGAIQPGQIATWSNGVVDLNPDPNVQNTVSNVVFLPEPAPPQIKVSVSCNGFSLPASVTLDLAPYTSPTPAGAFLFPFSAADLGEGEYAVTSAKHWANGGAAGTQIFAHDISVQRYDSQTDSWSQLKTGGSQMNNEDYRIWGKPVRAVANGSVEDWVDNEPTNTITVDSNGNLQFPSPTPDPGSGNRFWIRHGDVLVEYAHLQAGTLPPSLLVKGAPVTAGQTLGLAGNSGNSTNPHTHIQCQRDSLSGPLRPMPFRDAWVLDRTRFNSGDSHSLWVQLKAHGIPQEAVAIWPGFYWPGWPSFYEAAIDPLALILRGDIYVKLTLPDPPPIEVLRAQIEELVRTMTPDERKQALERVRAFKDYQNVVEQELNKLHGGERLK
jgi:hypothetical protein